MPVDITNRMGSIKSEWGGVCVCVCVCVPTFQEIKIAYAPVQ